MATDYNYRAYPWMVEGYEKFKGPNPWDSGAETLWYVGGFRWGVNKKHVFSPPKSPRPDGTQLCEIWAGVYSPDAGVLRLLPKAAQELWWSGQLPAEKMPWFIHELSAEKTVDTPTGAYFYGILLGGIAAAVWLICVAAVIRTIVTEGTFQDLLGDTTDLVVLAIAIMPFLIFPLLFWSWKAKSRRLKERAQAILRGGADST